MPECPVCNTRMYTKRIFPTLNKKFGCDACGWEMPVDEVHERGGLTKIAIDIANGVKYEEDDDNEEDEDDEAEQKKRYEERGY